MEQMNDGLSGPISFIPRPNMYTIIFVGPSFIWITNATSCCLPRSTPRSLCSLLHTRASVCLTVSPVPRGGHPWDESAFLAMAASLLPPAATLVKKYPALLHPSGAKPHAQRLIFRCGATSADDGWASLVDELKRSLQQADTSDTVTSNAGAGVTPNDLVTALPLEPSTTTGPAVGDATSAAAGAVNELLGVDAASSDGGGAAAIPDGLLSALLHLDASSNPVARAAGGALSGLDALTSGLSDAQRWALFGFLAATWLYLTARPGVLSGAMDTYVLAPLQLALDSVLGRRSLKMSDFVVGERIGEGSFGVVYAGAVVPKDGTVVEERSGRARTTLQNDDRYKEKVILKKVSCELAVM